MSEAIAAGVAMRPAFLKTEISQRGQWVEVPAIRVGEQTLIVRGNRIRVAALHDEEWLAEELADPQSCVAALKMLPRSQQPDILTFTQKIPHIEPRFDYAMERSSIAAADIHDYAKWWESLPQETRKNTRRAYKRGVTVEERAFGPEVIEGIMRVQNETPVRQGRRYTHYGKSFEQVQRDHSSFVDRSLFLCAYFEGEFIGFLKIVFRRDIASVLQLNSLAAHYDKRPSNALLTKGIEICAARGISHLTYGHFNYGNKGDTSIREFKVRHGFEEMLPPTYYVPLTAWGRVCVRARLYRGMNQLLPGPVLRAAVALRKRWYD